MLLLKRPTAASIRQFLADQAQRDFSYVAVGATAGSPPPGYVVDRTRVKLGEGPQAFEAAKAALRRWGQFGLAWVELVPAGTPMAKGEVVGVLAHVAGFWWLNACRVISVFDETGDICRFGCTYGTLPGHAESGEERFLVEWNQADNSVWYDILAFSRPNFLLTRLGYPMVRRTQKRFARESAAAMQRAVS